MSRKSWILGILAIVVAAASVAGGVFVLVQPVTYKTVPQLPSVTRSAQADPPSTTQSSAVLPPPPNRHDFVAQAMPTQLTVWKEGEEPLLAPAGNGSPNMDPNPAKMNGNGLVLPNTLESPAVQDDPNLDWAVLPGSEADTTVVVCHTKATANPPLPCNALTRIPTESDESSGYRAEMVLPTGTLKSELVDVQLTSKEGSNTEWPGLYNKEPGRWIVVMCNLETDPITGRVVNTYVSRFLVFHLIESLSTS